MNALWPDKTGSLCARMSRGFNGQDANSLLIVSNITQIHRGGGISDPITATYYKGSGTRNGCEREVIAMETEPVVYPGVGITSKENASNPQPGDPAPSVTTDSRNYLVNNQKRRYIVRRLTPTECARLQGFPRVVEVNIGNMTRDEIAMLCLAEEWIKVDPRTGEVFANRGPGGYQMDEYKKLTGTDVNGYLVYTLNFDGHKKQMRAHRLVWMSVHGAIPDGYVVDHINNNKKDNRIENLQLLTPVANSTKARADGLYLTGDDSPMSRSTEDERKTISYLYWHSDMTCKRLSEIFGLSDSRVQQIIHEYEWTDGADGSDSAQYKMWGNGIALPCAADVLGRIAHELQTEGTDTP